MNPARFGSKNEEDLRIPYDAMLWEVGAMFSGSMQSEIEREQFLALQQGNLDLELSFSAPSQIEFEAVRKTFTEEFEGLLQAPTNEADGNNEGKEGISEETISDWMFVRKDRS